MAYVFLSYSHEDGEYAARLAERMREEGIDTWLDSEIDYGDAWPDVIEEHLEPHGPRVGTMQVQVTDAALELARKKGGMIALDFVRPVG